MTEKTHKTFAFITGEDIFHVFKIDDTEATAGLVAGMRSEPIIVEISGNDHFYEESGWKFVDGKFVKKEIYDNPPAIVDEDDYEVE